MTTQGYLLQSALCHVAIYSKRTFVLTNQIAALPAGFRHVPLFKANLVTEEESSSLVKVIRNIVTAVFQSVLICGTWMPSVVCLY